MKIQVLKSKLHGIRVTACEIEYEGSITIDRVILKEAKIFPFEKVDVYNITNGERFTTYALPAPPGSRMCVLNGAAARKGEKGDKLIVATYGIVESEDALGYAPVVLIFDEENRIKEKREKTP